MDAVSKFLFPAVAAAAGAYFGGHLWNHVAIRAIGPEAQLALVVAVATILGGVLGDKLAGHKK